MIENRQEIRAHYAATVGPGRGVRPIYPEKESHVRTPWQRDRDRVIHASSFKRMQYKTQVFINHEGDFFRTRLTHSLEVSQIARSLARHLLLDEDLAEAIALAHDLGHTPFGHAGEDVLSKKMEGKGGFDHNTQALRQVVLLEHRYLKFDGLNLTWELLEGMAKHNGPQKNPSQQLLDLDEQLYLDLGTYASAEAQVAALADDIAYHAHDLDDGLKSGLLNISDIAHLPVVGEALREVQQEAGAPTSLKTHLVGRVRHEMVRRIIHKMVGDVAKTTQQNLKELAPKTVEDIRLAKAPIVLFSQAMFEANKAIRKFLFDNLYHHWQVNRMTYKARCLVSSLFDIFEQQPQLLPIDNVPSKEEAPELFYRKICDYIASMTDRFAMDEYKRLTDISVSGAIM